MRVTPSLLGLGFACALFLPVLTLDAFSLDARAKAKTDNGAVDPMKLGGSEYCGHCHVDIFHQWNASTHHFSSFNNPVYRKVVLDTIEHKGLPTFAFCARCHDPILKSSGETVKLDVNSWKANAGITCLSCHRIVAIGVTSGEYRIAEPILHPFALSDNPTLAKVHKSLIEITPWLHRGVLSKPFYATSEYCAACHSLTVPGSINGAAPMPFSDEIGQLHRYHHSAPGNKLPGRCIECHMPKVPSNDPAAKDGLIRSHRFTGSNTALPTFNRDLDQRKAVEAFLSDGVITLRVAGIRTRSEQPFRLAKAVSVHAGDRLEIALEIKNAGAGHQFPTGTVDSNEAWLSAILSDGQSHPLASIGQLDDRGLIPPEAIRFGTRFIDSFGNPTDRRNTTTDAISVAEDTVVPIQGRRTVFIKFRIPADATPPFVVDFALNWRKYSPAFIAWVFNDRQTPPLPITKLAELRLTLPAKVAKIPVKHYGATQ